MTYKTQQLQTIDNKTKFPFAVVYADGRISDYEKPIFAPNADISKINISLYVNASSIHLYFRFKATTIDIGSKLVTNNYVEWKDNDIKNKSGLKNKINFCLSSSIFGKSVLEALKKLEEYIKENFYIS